MSSRDLQQLIWMAESNLRRSATVLAVRDGYACPEPGCGRYYRHTHDGLWWPPEGSSPPVSREANERWFSDRAALRQGREDVTGEFGSPDSPGRDDSEPSPTGANRDADHSAKPSALPIQSTKEG